uniref:hypothetical protein n=1 Tax=Nocardioides sp. R-C-SC26 TaxID=2870414 RepID=UPI001E3155EF
MSASRRWGAGTTALTVSFLTVLPVLLVVLVGLLGSPAAAEPDGAGRVPSKGLLGDTVPGLDLPSVGLDRPARP